MLRADADLEAAYYLRLEPGRNRLVFDSWPRAGDLPFMVELERPVPLAPGKPLKVKVLVEGTVCEVYVEDRIAMSARMYNQPQGDWGVFVSEGEADFRSPTLHMRAEAGSSG
jgi:beta-fructofuranosidase